MDTFGRIELEHSPENCTIWASRLRRVTGQTLRSRCVCHPPGWAWAAEPLHPCSGAFRPPATAGARIEARGELSGGPGCGEVGHEG